MNDADVLVIGAGCIGASVAKHLAESGHQVLVVEKEAAPAMHQSGRNSGVIHAGYNLKPGSEKARFCVEGSRRMRAYCADKGVSVVQGGILVVAQDEAQLGRLRELETRGKANGVAVRLVDEAGLCAIEPAARGIAALHAPEGASVDSAAYVAALVADAQQAGARFRFNTPVRGLVEQERSVHVQGPDLEARVVVNCAGLQADRLAGPLAADVRVVPFRGTYATVSGASAALVRSHIYQAPDPRFPFLGVHLSRRFDGSVAAGPGAMLAFGREAYGFWRGSPRDATSMLGWPGFWRLMAGPALRQVPGEVQRSLSLAAIARQAQALVPDVKASDFAWGQAGNRAQLVDRAGNLVEDMVVRSTDRSVHVLNAVSPGMTCSLPFGEHVAALAAKRL